MELRQFLDVVRQAIELPLAIHTHPATLGGHSGLFYSLNQAIH